ncbi:hypothetical protein [Mesorhizobium sp.]|uniref:hypothetical protein n=1 Tax=Mesorhizobium sp. TaxID=1871066 RepID=UPI00121F610D|nr:hypothetical protein [Mesorhizobium sp.]TIN05876.1 MAG: hypothetical protein E5Y14_31395 [Mesorhizobium sp.]
MTQPAFTICLGNGIYLDSDGNVLQSPLPEIPAYSPPFKLPIDPAKARDAVKSVQKALKDINKDPEVLAKFLEFGFDTKILDILSGVAKIAGMVAPVLAAVAIAYDVLKVLGVFKEGPSALELLVKQRFDELEKNVDSIKIMIETHRLGDARNGVQKLLDFAKDFTLKVRGEQASLQELQGDQKTLKDTIIENDNFNKLMSQHTYVANFDRDDHTRVWWWMQDLIHTMPHGPGAAPWRVPLPDNIAFDHRLMVPLACFAAEAYITVLRAIEPEYRSTGFAREELRTLSRHLDDLAQKMRSDCLGRTYYRREHFAFPSVYLTDREVDTLLGQFPKVSKKCSRFPVGALDLRYHGNAFFGPFLDSLFIADVRGEPHPTRHGGMEFRWVPPAVLVRGPFDGTWTITNPDECAKAANEAAEKDYADLVSMSGYTELVRLAALFRNEAMEPSQSQTVHAWNPTLLRQTESQITVTVQSDNIPMTGVISSQAAREPQKCLALVHVRTQPPSRLYQPSYKIKLRTLSAISSGRWDDRGYASFRWPQYEDESPDTDFFKLVFQQTTAGLDEELLFQGKSPEDLIRKPGVAELKAHTFDWWIPLKPAFGVWDDRRKVKAELAALGWMSDDESWNGKAGGQAVMSLSGFQSSDLFDEVAPHLAWEPGRKDWEGQRREPKKQMVEVEYSASWEEDSLRVSLRNKPSDRNYVVYLVIEETLVSGTIIHTAAPVHMNGQLTFVPQSFFDREQEAREKFFGKVAEFNQRFSESAEPGPINPILTAIRPGDVLRADTVVRVSALMKEHQPELLNQLLRQPAQQDDAAEVKVAT